MISLRREAKDVAVVLILIIPALRRVERTVGKGRKMAVQYIHNNNQQKY